MAWLPHTCTRCRCNVPGHVTVPNTGTHSVLGTATTVIHNSHSDTIRCSYSYECKLQYCQQSLDELIHMIIMQRHMSTCIQIMFTCTNQDHNCQPSWQLSITQSIQITFLLSQCINPYNPLHCFITHFYTKLCYVYHPLI